MTAYSALAMTAYSALAMTAFFPVTARPKAVAVHAPRRAKMDCRASLAMTKVGADEYKDFIAITLKATK